MGEDLLRVFIKKVEVTGAVYPDGAGIDLLVADFSGLDIGVGADDAVAHGCQVDGGEGAEKTAVGGRAMDVGVVHGQGVFYEEFFRCFRIMGIVVHQRFDQCAVFNINDFVLGQGQAEITECDGAIFAFQFIAADITLVEQRIADAAFAEKIAAGQGGVFKVQIKRMVRGYAVKGIEFAHLIRGNKGIGKRSDIKLLLAEIDVDPLNNSIEEFF